MASTTFSDFEEGHGEDTEGKLVVAPVGESEDHNNEKQGSTAPAEEKSKTWSVERVPAIEDVKRVLAEKTRSEDWLHSDEEQGSAHNVMERSPAKETRCKDHLHNDKEHGATRSVERGAWSDCTCIRKRGIRRVKRDCCCSEGGSGSQH
ncbi:hypothetical protein M758_UG294100 [Ceratodon purpureus]|nr:hypothetical protein M758_UG294100 [Ceratodon purpureus]